ncbi:MAG: amidohydrolase [Acidimicrobiaceae bacterium]|nr:amidohydrolase [Acidimicrobiaceae bacterium]
MDDSTRHIVISTDGHCGADILDYKPFLESRYHEEFDAWASDYQDAWGALEDAVPVGRRIGVASYTDPLNWESSLRLQHNHGQGIAAEVLFPNTSPPFFPSGAISAPGPANAKEYEYRFAGLRAHNRWLAEFCNEAPAQRAGFAQVFLDDVDAAIAEVRWAKQAGLKGVLLPSDHVLMMANLYYPRYDPFWEVCADLELPVHRHGIKATEVIAVGGPGSPLVGSVEQPFYSIRAISHLIFAGVFERYPKLKFVTTEPPDGSGILSLLARMDAMMNDPVALALYKGDPLTRKPSEYFATNCFVGNPFDLRSAYERGLPNLMWGSDLPHGEGTSPYSVEAMRAVFAGVPEIDIRKMLTTTAADLYGFDLEVLRPIADRIGPTLAQISTPLGRDEAPQYPEDTRCVAFAEFAGVAVKDIGMSA